MKRIPPIIIIFLMVMGGAASAQFSRPQLEAQINAQVRTNGVGAITGSVMNGVLGSMTQSYALRVPNLSSLRSLTGMAANDVFYREGFFTPGDGGQAAYSFSTSSCTINSGGGDNGFQVAPSSGGGCWNLNMPVVGGVSVAVWGAFGGFSGDSGPAIEAALSALGATGGTLNLEQVSYWNQAQALVVPSTVTLTCDGYYANWPPGSGEFDRTNSACTIYQGAGTTLTVDGEVSGIGVYQYQVHLNVLTQSRAALRAYVNGMSGAGVTIGNHAAHLNHVLIGGFATCIDQFTNSANQVRIDAILADCTAGYKVDQSFEPNFLFNIELWPFTTSGQAHVLDQWVVSGLADNGSGLWRVTTSTTNDIATGEQIWIDPRNTAQGAGGYWTVTSIDSTHFDLQGSATAPTTTGTTATGATYVTVTSVNNLAIGMTVSDGAVNIPAGATIAGVWRSRNAITLDQAHAAVGAGSVTLTFGSPSFTGTGMAFYDATWRTGDGFNVGRADSTMCDMCIAFAHQVGFHFVQAISNNWIHSEIDHNVAHLGGGPLSHLANQNTVPVGVWWDGGVGNSYGNMYQGSIITSEGVAILNNVPGLSGGNLAGQVMNVSRLASATDFATFIEDSTGALTVNGPFATTHGPILIDSTNTPLMLSNARMNLAVPYSSALSVADPPLFYGESTLGGTVDRRGPSILIGQRITAANPTTAAVDLYSGAGAVDEKYWRFTNTGASQACLATMTDVYSAGNNAWCAARTGTTVNSVNFSVPIALKILTVGTLPTCNGGAQGQLAYVSDATGPTYNATLTGGGSVRTLALCNATNWVAH